MGSHVSIHTVQMLGILAMLDPLDSNADLNTTATTTSFLFVMHARYRAVRVFLLVSTALNAEWGASMTKILGASYHATVHR